MKLIKQLVSKIVVLVVAIKDNIFGYYFVYVKGLTKVYCIGDSHTVIFKERKLFTELQDVYFNVTTVHGATVSGLDNPNSNTNAGFIFNKKMKQLKANDIALFLLGEVDLGFVIWWRHQRYNASLEEMYNLAFDNYKKLLLSAAICKKVIVISVPLPTIGDDDKMLGEVANLRQEIKATQRERTELTLRFNNDLAKFCTDQRFIFAALDDICLDQHTGIIKSSLLNDNLMDHHYNMTKYANIIQLKIKGVF